MITHKKNTYRPIFKSFIRLRENVQNRKKLLNFKKKKWLFLIKQYERQSKWFKKYKACDHVQLLASKYPSKGKAYDRKFRETLTAKKRFSSFYGGVGRKYLKKQINFAFKNNKKHSNTFFSFLEHFERRLDTVLYRAKLVVSIRTAHLLIAHGKVSVNNAVMKKKSYLLKQGDLISIEKGASLIIRENVKQTDTWPIPPKYLFINYKTMEIVFGDIQNTNFGTSFNLNLELEKIILNYKQH